MKYRKFGKLDWEVSNLGFGAMRMPTIDGKTSQIDEKEATKMIYHAIDQGVNYIDTAFIYHGGNSEPFLGKILKGDYRKKVKLATKLPPWSLKEASDLDKILHQQLKSLQTDCIDFYLLHGLNDRFWPMLKEMDVLEWADKQKSLGKIKHLGFSFHDHLDVFKEIVNEYNGWEFCQIQYNFIDIDFQAGKEGLDYAAEHDLGIVIMEPLRGGQFLDNIPDSIQSIWDKASVKRSIADWALRWLWDQPEVSVVLSGMSTYDQLEENLKVASEAEIGSLEPSDRMIFDQVRESYQAMTPIDCTMCKYCLPCEQNVAIPTIFKRYNDTFRYKDLDRAKYFYKVFLPDGQASQCIECYECEDHCPQGIEIVEWLKKCHEGFMS